MEALPGVNMWELPLPAGDRERIERELAAVLVELHSHTRDSFGSVAEPVTHARWVDVFLPRLREVRRQPEVDARLPSDVSGGLDAAIDEAERALVEQGTPTLVHGDIWAANVIVEQRAAGWQLSGLVDPSTQYADVEMELAYLERFSHVAGPTFWSTYLAQAPRRRGYEYRRLFYWLHSYLVHVWLFEDQVFRDETAWVLEQIQKGP
jgi:fructosamine-3-kinase